MSEGIVLIRLTIACVCGGLIGVQAEIHQRPGGLRTHALAAMGAAMFCLTGLYFTGKDEESIRIVQGVASGVGFIGAASVLRGRTTIHGVATAASIWISSAIGCFAAFGGWRIALPAALIVSLLNAATLSAQQRWGRHKPKPTS